MKKRINSLADGKRMVGGNGRRVAAVLKLDGLGTAGALRALFGADWVVHNGEYLEALSFYGDKFEKILTALCLAFNGHGVNKTQLKTALALAKEIIDHEDAMAGNCFVGRRKNQVPVPDRAADIARTVKKVAASLRSIGGKRKDKEASVDRVRAEIAGFLRARVSLPRIDNPLD